ncbi:serine/threonine protein kinase [Rhodobacteraceae bacterium]|nr:serine/threonine protein kinase [Paracoccaceae bacterium]
MPIDPSAVGDHEAEITNELPAGTKLMYGQYTIEQYLNSGGFGITYLARDSLNRYVVIKECFPNSFCRRSQQIVRADSPDHSKELLQIVKLFTQEALSLARVEHQNIVGVHQVFEENQTAYMALDFIPGRDLQEIALIKNIKLTPVQVTSILVKLLDAIGHVHKNGLLHRDISPDNIIVRDDGEPVLIDFGAAREQSTRATRLLSAMRIVKDGYSPQEFYVADSNQSPSCDLYSLAATFYHIITGERPPDAQMRITAIASQEPDPYRPLIDYDVEFDATFCAVLDQALAVLPRDRVQTADEWLNALGHKATRRRISKRVLEPEVVDSESSGETPDALNDAFEGGTASDMVGDNITEFTSGPVPRGRRSTPGSFTASSARLTSGNSEIEQFELSKTLREEAFKVETYQTSDDDIDTRTPVASLTRSKIPSVMKAVAAGLAAPAPPAFAGRNGVAAATLVVLVGLGGGAWWFMNQQDAEAPEFTAAGVTPVDAPAPVAQPVLPVETPSVESVLQLVTPSVPDLTVPAIPDVAVTEADIVLETPDLTVEAPTITSFAPDVILGTPGTDIPEVTSGLAAATSDPSAATTATPTPSTRPVGRPVQVVAVAPTVFVDVEDIVPIDQTDLAINPTAPIDAVSTQLVVPTALPEGNDVLARSVFALQLQAPPAPIPAEPPEALFTFAPTISDDDIAAAPETNTSAITVGAGSVVMDNGSLIFDATYENGKWVTRVIAASEGNRLEVGDRVVSDATTGIEVLTENGLRNLVARGRAKGLGAVNLIIERNDTLRLEGIGF